MKFPQRKWVYVFNVWPSGLFRPEILLHPRMFFKLLWSLWLGKVGFESDGTDRAVDVEYSIRQRLGLDIRIIRVVRVKVFMYRGIEKAVHNVVAPLRSRRLKGCSGWTEIFAKINVVSGWLILCGAYYIGLNFRIFEVSIGVWLMLLVMVTPYPLDLSLLVLILAIAEYALCVGAGWIIYTLTIALLGA